jgi:hypothetical protein
MRKFWVFLFIFALSTGAWTKEEDETLISGNIESGGYGGPVLKLCQIYGNDGILFGGQGGWIVNHQFVLGGGGYGLTNNIEVKDVNLELDGGYEVKDMYLTFGYGGVLLEYIMNSRKLIHLNFFSLIGAGGVGFRDKVVEQPNPGEVDAFFVVEPGVNLMLNVTRNFRIGIGATYLKVSGVSMQEISDDDLTSPTFQLNLKFGSF